MSTFCVKTETHPTDLRLSWRKRGQQLCYPHLLENELIAAVASEVRGYTAKQLSTRTLSRGTDQTTRSPHLGVWNPALYVDLVVFQNVVFYTLSDSQTSQRSSWVWMISSRVGMRSSRVWMRSSRVWKRSGWVWMRSSWVWKRSNRVWKRSNRVDERYPWRLVRACI